MAQIELQPADAETPTAPLPSPFWFDGAGVPLFGWYHAPVGPRRACAVLLAGAIGWEGAVTHRAMRHLAERLAAAGFPVLRYDHAGQGDSALGDKDADLVRAWIDGIRAALDRLQALSGATQLAVAGLRMGGTIALAAAAEGGGVASAVLIGPLTGSAWAREMRAYQALNVTSAEGEPPPGSENAPGDGESAGFLISKQTLEDAVRLDLKTFAAPVPAKILLLAREDLPMKESLPLGLRAAGAVVAVERVPGLPALLQDPLTSEVPDACWEKVVSWLSAGHATAAVAVNAASTPPQVATELRAHRSAAPVRERALRFGPKGRLFGILTEPLSGALQEAPVALLLSVGFSHRIGPNRLYVEWARALAGLGLRALRFDISGIGDSPPGPGAFENGIYLTTQVADVQAAIDELCRLVGASRFAAVGMCSGAYLAYHAAKSDSRVVAQVLLNPRTFDYRRGESLEVNSILSTRYYREALFQRATWSRLLRGEISVGTIAGTLALRQLKRLRERVGALGEGLRGRKAETKVARDFRLFSEREGHTLALFSSTDEGIDYLESHLGQGCRSMGSFPRFRFEIVRGPDHTFSQLWAQRWLTARLVTFLTGLAGAAAEQVKAG